MSYKTIKPDIKKTLFFAKRQLVELVYDAVNLEGIHYTLPEIQTLLDGVSVGGYKLAEQQIALNQIAAWKFLFASIENNTFSLNKTYADNLYAIASTNAQSLVSNNLDEQWDEMLAEADQLVDIYHRAIFVFLRMARTQFFYDVNKRMGRFMMNGLLLSKGYPAINLPATRQLEFNKLMLEFYKTNNTQAMTEFMLSCLTPDLIEIMAE